MRHLFIIAALIFSSSAFAAHDANFGDHMTTLDLIPIASVVATANGTGVDTQIYSGQIALVLDAKNTAGSSPTMAITFEDSANNSSFTAISPSVAFTGLTTSTSVQKVVMPRAGVRRYIRAVMTLGGTNSPAYLISVKGYAMKKYLP